jgi:hypothetical protein
MEYLSFNKCGQWELHKAEEPKSDYKPGSKEYQVHHGAALTGELHEDRGQKGSLHNFSGGKRPKQINWKNVGVPSKAVASVYNERNPGVGD